MPFIARDKETGRVIRAKDSSRKGSYECLECSQKLILKKGKEKAAHFAHQSLVDCSNHENESVQHKNMKLFITQCINEGVPIKIRHYCHMCHSYSLTDKTDKIKTAKEEVSIPRYGSIDDDGTLWGRADIMCYDSEGKPSFIIEICHTHKTDEVYREDWDWAEISTKQYPDLMTMPIESLELKCIRDKKWRLPDASDDGLTNVCDYCNKNLNIIPFDHKKDNTYYPIEIDKSTNTARISNIDTDMIKHLNSLGSFGFTHDTITVHNLIVSDWGSCYSDELGKHICWDDGKNTLDDVWTYMKNPELYYFKLILLNGKPYYLSGYVMQSYDYMDV